MKGCRIPWVTISLSNGCGNEASSFAVNVVMRLGRLFAERLFVCSLISLSKSCAAASFSRASSFVRGILVQSEFLFSSFARLERMPRNCGRGWAVSCKWNSRVFFSGRVL